jgi:hypothetical protein
MVIAIDFDGTIAEHTYPECGKIKPHAKEVINRLYNAGHEIIIWTCRWDHPMELCRQFLAEHGIKYHKLNEHVDWAIEMFKNDTRKIFADVYIDDRQLGGIPDCWLKIEKLLHKKHLKSK